MPNTAQLFQLPDDTVFPNDLPSILLDPLDAPGVLLIQDFANRESFPDGRIGVQGSANPAYVYNLARNAYALPRGATWDGKFVGPDGSMTYDGKGVKFTRPNGDTLTDSLASTGDNGFLTGMNGKDFLYIIWARIGARVNQKYQQIAAVGGNVNLSTDPNAFAVYLSDKTVSPDFIGVLQVWSQNGTKNEIGFQHTGQGLVPGTLVQLAFFLDFGTTNTTLKMYRDGALIRTTTVNGMTALQSSPNALILGGQNAIQGDATIYRHLFERIDLSGRDPLAVVQADYTANMGRF